LPQPAVDLAEQRVLVLSLAPSMAASDVAPSRVARARFAAQDALRALRGADVGLVIYAEEPYAVTPLTDDPDVIEAVLPVLEPALMPGRGARLDRAIDEARGLLEGVGAREGRIVVLSDGPGQAPEAARAAAERAAQAGFRVGVLGVGEDDGAGLEAIARAGGGRFAVVGVGGQELEAVVGAPGSSLPSAAGVARDDVQVDAWRDAGRWLLWVPLLLVPFAFRRGWAGALALAAFLAMPTAPARAGVTDDLFARPDQQGARAFAAGQHAAAADLFQDPAWRAAALYREGDYAGAVDALEGLEDVESVYNRGNGLARAGRLDEALAAYEQVLAQDPSNEDARHNRDLVRKLLEQKQQPSQPPMQKQQQQEQQPSQPQQGEQPQPQPQQASGSQSDAASQPQASEGEGQDRTDGSPSGSDASGQESSPPSGEAGDEPAEGKGDASPGAGAQSAQQAPQQDEPAQGRAGGDEEAARAAPPQTAARGEAGEERGEGGRRGDAAPTARTSADELPPTDTPQEAGAGAGPQPLSEAEQATEQWLRRVPDDPAGLLREKLRRRYAERRYGARPGGIR
jgi:Ca-activated chloride channel family protein